MSIFSDRLFYNLMSANTRQIEHTGRQRKLSIIDIKKKTQNLTQKTTKQNIKIKTVRYKNLRKISGLALFNNQ